MKFEFQQVRSYMAVVALSGYPHSYGTPNGAFDFVIWTYGSLRAESDFQPFSLYLSSPAYSSRRALELGVQMDGSQLSVVEVMPVGEGCDDEAVLDKLKSFFEMVVSGEQEFAFPLDLTKEEISSFIRWFSVG